MKELICIVCPNGCHLKVEEEKGCAVTGAKCDRGAQYGKTELTNPTRVVTSTVKLVSCGSCRLPVKTNLAVPKSKIFDIMDVINEITASAPVCTGDVLVENILGTGADLVACKTVEC